MSRSQQRKKIGGSSGRLISILYYFMLQKPCHWTCVIRILELVIGVRSTHMPSVSLRMIALEVCRFEFIWMLKKKKIFNFGGAGVTVAILFSNAGYKTRIPLLFILMIESIILVCCSKKSGIYLHLRYIHDKSFDIHICCSRIGSSNAFCINHMK